jgi:hypothetical protein
MTYPNFLIIGAAKTATTTLSSMLAGHPQAAIARIKESHFFSIDQFYSRGWPWYQSLFDHAGAAKAVGDASTSYSRLRHHPDTLKRIVEHLGHEVKIILMVRHPIKRIESAYLERMSTPGNQREASINVTVKNQPMMINSSRYWEVFDAYRTVFGESNIKVVWFEEFIKDTTQEYAAICDFLQINRHTMNDADIKINSRDSVQQRIADLGQEYSDNELKWLPEVYQWTVDQLRDDNLRFLAHFNKPVHYWGELF